jgi:hypothetical protein
MGEVGYQLTESPEAFEVGCPGLPVSIRSCCGVKAHPPNPLVLPPQSCVADTSVVSLSGGGNLYIGGVDFRAVRALIANDSGRKADESTAERLNGHHEMTPSTSPFKF